MFVARDITTQLSVTSLDPHWIEQRNELRRMAREGQVVCPGCADRLWFRSGRKLRPHFAHRTIKDCPLNRQSVEVLEAKAQLYEWLITQYPGKVEMDVDLNLPGWKQRADLVVRPDATKTFVYWVFDRRQNDRWKLLAEKSDPNRVMHFLHTNSTGFPEDENRLRLTASQRDFLDGSRYDCPYLHPVHLHFLDTENKRILIYRGLHLVHQPHIHRWQAMRSGGWAEALICRKTGEIVFNSDVEKWLDWEEAEKRRKQEEEEQKRKEKEQREAWLREKENARHAAQSKPLPPTPTRSAPSPPPLSSLPPRPFKSSPTQSSNKPVYRANRIQPPTQPPKPPKDAVAYGLKKYRCEECGIITSDYVSASDLDGTCLCRQCHPKRWGPIPTKPNKDF
jgi:hypothetical protein